jgi:hypothetical protein
MTRRIRASRLAWLVAAVFQLLVPTVWSVSDARADALSVRTSTVHVESPGTSGCARVHAADCAVCRVVATASAPSAPATVHVPVVPLLGAPPADVARRAASTRAPGDPPQRAPPV